MQAFYHQQYCDLEFRPSAVTVGKATVGALTIRTGFWGCMYIYIYIYHATAVIRNPKIGLVII